MQGNLIASTILWVSAHPEACSLNGSLRNDVIAHLRRAREELFGRFDGLSVDAAIPYRPQFTGDYTAEGELEPQIRPGEHGLRIHTRC